MQRVVVPEHIETVARDAVDAALAVHREFGPGLLESAYRDCLQIELVARGHEVEREQLLPITYRVQVATYLRLLRLPLGLLINFHVPLLKDGLHRVLNLHFQTVTSDTTSD